VKDLRILKTQNFYIEKVEYPIKGNLAMKGNAMIKSMVWLNVFK